MEMTYNEAKVLIAQAYINIEEGHCIVEANSRIHKAMLRITEHTCGGHHE